MGQVYADITETMGRTPLVRLNRITRELKAEIVVKCEFFNPLSSVKDRIGVSMIEAAERDGSLKADTVIVERIEDFLISAGSIPDNPNESLRHAQFRA